MNTLPDWHYHLGKPALSGILRSSPDDFQVSEELSFNPSGEGEHVFLRVRKRNANTEWVAKQLARFAEIHPKNVSYAGLKDRNAVTEQWFSLHLLNQELNWSDCINDEFSVIEHTRNSRKLKRGALTANRFRIVIRNIQGSPDEWLERGEQIRRDGVPNYFGEQRFGHDGNNITQAEAMFSGSIRVKDRHRKSLYLSAARSYLFNEVLSRRVAGRSWNQAQAGDVMMLDGSHSVFVADEITPDIERRINEFDIHPTGPLWGAGELLTQSAVAELENDIADGNEIFRDGLLKAGLKQERRALRLKADNLEIEVQGEDTVTLTFRLPAGSYATSVIREFCQTKDS